MPSRGTDGLFACCTLLSHSLLARTTMIENTSWKSLKRSPVELFSRYRNIPTNFIHS